MKILVEAQTQGSGAVVRKVPIGDGIPEISFSQIVELVVIWWFLLCMLPIGNQWYVDNWLCLVPSIFQKNRGQSVCRLL